ncbi:hypothetical protein 000TH008_86 [Bacillus phage 000TH008]|nr:hypothetical protein 000TH008_86 [Bacillus phage 000TH008]QQO40780.1 hypothetical protein 000TH009_86 [Bacillus phage 000TH009]
MSDVYYKILMYTDLEDYECKATVVTMQWFDERDYPQDNFIKDERGRALEFDSEDEAVQWVLDNVKDGHIDPRLKRNRFNQNDILK